MIKKIKNILKYYDFVYYVFKGGAVYILLCIRCVIPIFSFFLPLKSKQILFRAYEGRSYACNPKAITEHILNNSYDYTIVWAFREPDKFDYLKNKGIKLIKVYSLEYYYYYLTSGVLIFNDFWSSFISPRKRQIFINTWHGSGALKSVGLSTMPNPIDCLLYKMRHNVGYMVSGCKEFTKIIPVSFGKDLIFLEYGLPRNDIFYMEKKLREYIIGRVKQSLNVENKKIVLYAPTYRENFKKETYGIDFEGVLEALKEKFGGDWIFCIRGHYFNNCSSINNNNILDVSSYGDMQDILLISDVLITDYSSSSWDFSLQKRPCFLYLPDLEEYKKDFSFYNPIETLPYQKAKDNIALIENILNFDKNLYLDNVDKFYKDFGGFDVGTSSANIVRFMDNIIN